MYNISYGADQLYTFLHHAPPEPSFSLFPDQSRIINYIIKPQAIDNSGGVKLVQVPAWDLSSVKHIDVTQGLIK